MAPPNSLVAPIYSHTKACIFQFQRLHAIFENEQLQTQFDISNPQVCDIYGQFNIWAGNIGALQSIQSASSLDYRLREVPKVSKQIVALLEDLEEIVEDICAIASGERSNRVSSPITFDEVENFPTENYVGSARAAPTPTQQICGSSSEIGELFQSIPETLTSLFKLSILIRNSSTRDRYAKALTAAFKNPFNDQFDIDHVGNKFPRLYNDEISWLRIRLGKAITQRRQYLQYCREHHDKLAKASEPQIIFSMPSKFVNEKNLHSADGQQPQIDEDIQTVLSKPTSTLAPTTASTVIPARFEETQRDQDVSDDDTRSQTSYATSVGEDDSNSRLSVVQLQEIAPTGLPFECPYCWTIQTINNQRSWQKHVMRDLKPYVCTFEECDMKMFADRHTWFTHELQTHRVEWKCCFCTHAPYQSLSTFQKHVQIHIGGAFAENQLPTLIKICQRPLDRWPASSCPFCDDWEAKLREVNKHISSEEILVITPEQFRHHVGSHMEQLALFAIPRGFKEDGDAGSDRAAPLQSLDSLLDRSVVKPDYEDEDNPRIHVAAFEGQAEEVRELLGSNPSPDVLHSKGKTWGSVLGAAAAGGHVSIADFLVQRELATESFQTGLNFPLGPNGWTPIHWAASNGHSAMINFFFQFLELSPSIYEWLKLDSRNHDGLAPLDLALRHGHDDVAKLLEDYLSTPADSLGPRINTQNKQEGIIPVSQTLTYAEVSAHSTKEDLYMVIHNKVYNATRFLDEHPGGDEVLLDVAGQDATEAFEDVGHSDDAREILEGFLIGNLKGTEAGTEPTVSKKQEGRILTFQTLTYVEVSIHSTKEDLYMVIHNKVYNATKFLDKHPGGDEVLLDVAGQDATEAFEDVGHSDDAREILEGFLIGNLKGTEADTEPTEPTASNKQEGRTLTSQTLTYAEVSTHSTKDDLYMVIHNKVYNVTNFLYEHPGGDEVLLDVAGQDATEAFEDVGHSDDAREVLEGFLVCNLEGFDELDPKPGESKKWWKLWR